MRKTLFGLILGLLVFAVPAFAQHPHSGGGGHQGGSSHENHGNNNTHQGQNHQGQNHGDHQHGVTNPRQNDRGHFEGDHGRHTNDRDRGHFDGRHFDRGYHEGHFGRNHRFRIGGPVFYGGYWRFWYGGFWFDYYDTWPNDWCYCDDVYIDYDADSDCYFLYNPVHPGFRLRIGVVF